MSDIDNKLLQKYQDNILSKTQRGSQSPPRLEHTNSDTSDDDSDAILQELEDEIEQQDSSFSQRYREARLQELSNQIQRARNVVNENNSISGGETFPLLPNEAELMKITTSSPTARVVVLFKNDCFQTSKMMEDAINTISKKHLTQSTRFVRINAVDAPFLTTRIDQRYRFEELQS
ncbi:unnamed protein product [Ambrosiozyma monospora]|uniref:Unnamed protein product n=1 Tax=Ambrosiozyma monospora TaxID=43982 RepID=A0ACB5TBI4_AMBMO|nr:unnamed protein product [Ambrosiozyma monospora]